MTHPLCIVAFKLKMVFVCGCVCGAPKPRKKIATNEKVKMDFRRADPNYVNFVPKTCADAIDLFNRHRTLGLQPDLFPECFVHCSRALPDDEIDKFHRFIVTPSGDVGKGGEKPTVLDQQLEEERRQLERECVQREFKALCIEEEQPMSQDDEKCPMSVSEEVESSSARIWPVRAELSQSDTKPMSDEEKPKLMPDYIRVSQR